MGIFSHTIGLKSRSVPLSVPLMKGSHDRSQAQACYLADRQGIQRPGQQGQLRSERSDPPTQARWRHPDSSRGRTLVYSRRCSGPISTTCRAARRTHDPGVPTRRDSSIPMARAPTPRTARIPARDLARRASANLAQACPSARSKRCESARSENRIAIFHNIRLGRALPIPGSGLRG